MGSKFAARLSVSEPEHTSTNLGLRGGSKIFHVRSKVSTFNLVKKVKTKNPQPAYNLPPMGWWENIRRTHRSDVSVKGMAKGRKRPVFHYWTKSKIKEWKEARKIHMAHVRKQKAKLPVKNYGRGVRRLKFKWLPSEYEKQKLEEAEAKKKMAEEKVEAAAEEEVEKEEAGGGEIGGDEVDDQPAAAAAEGDAGGGDDEFIFPGMDDEDDDGPGF